MRDDWIFKNPNTTEKMPEFEYYNFENYLLRNYYIYMTICAQGIVSLINQKLINKLLTLMYLITIQGYLSGGVWHIISYPTGGGTCVDF